MCRALGNKHHQLLSTDKKGKEGIGNQIQGEALSGCWGNTGADVVNARLVRVLVCLGTLRCAKTSFSFGITTVYLRVRGALWRQNGIDLLNCRPKGLFFSDCFWSEDWSEDPASGVLKGLEIEGWGVIGRPMFSSDVRSLYRVHQIQRTNELYLLAVSKVLKISS